MPKVTVQRLFGTDTIMSFKSPSGFTINARTHDQQGEPYRLYKRPRSSGDWADQYDRPAEAGNKQAYPVSAGQGATPEYMSYQAPWGGTHWQSWYRLPYLPHGYTTDPYTHWVVYHCACTVSRRQMKSFLQSWSDLVFPASSLLSHVSGTRAARVCWQCGTLWQAGGPAECPECGLHAWFEVDGVSLPPVRCDLSFLPSHVVSALETLPSPVYVCLLSGLSKWARLVKRHSLRSVQNGKARVSPPDWHVDGMLVLHTEPPGSAYSESNRTTKPKGPEVQAFQFLMGTQRCPTCSRVRWCDVRVVGPVCSYIPRAVCLSRVAGVSYMQKSLAAASSVCVCDIYVGHVVPLYLTTNYDCRREYSDVPSPEVPGWADHFVLPLQPTAEESAAHLRVMTLNCGGAQGKLSVMIGVVLSHDPDVAFLQECWDADIEGQLALRVYVVCMSAVQGPDKGMCVLMHRRLWAPEMKQCCDVLIDERSWLAVLIHRDTNVVSLLVDVHMDPEINSTAKEEILSAVGAMIDRVRPHEAVVSGDFNVPRNSKSLVERVVSKGHALSKLHIPYDRGEKTNYTSTGQTAVATEIDYILVSKHIGVAQKGVYPGVSTHMALVCALTGMGCQTAKVQKRYKHRVTTDEQKRRAARLLAPYWWWMAGTAAHHDAWVACYWSIADGILPPSSHRVSAQAILDRGKGLVRKGVTQRELHAWHEEVQQHLYVRGVRMNDQVLSTVSVTSHTTRAIQPATKTPRPYPQLKSRADQRQDVQAALRTTASQLEFYHISRGQSVNVSVLVHAAQPGKQLAAWDEPHFDTILRLRALGLPTSPDDTQSLLSILPRDPQINAYTLREALDRGGSDATSRDEIPVSLLAAMPHAGDKALYHYMRRLRLYPDAVSNQILQLGIYKSGLTHLFQSYRPIKLASAANSMQAGVVQHEVNFRAEVDGSWAGNTFSYRKGLSP